MADDIDLDDFDASGIVDPIVRRAHRKWRRDHDYYSYANANWLFELKFAHGDTINNYQWPVEIYRDRGAQRPSLTVNETRQHNLHIINEAKQNKAQVKYRPTGGAATEEAAEVYEGMYRHIANISNAQMAQGMAISFQVQAGLGWTLIEADYRDMSPKPDPTFMEQEIFIRPIHNPLSVMLDSDCHAPDGEGARHGFLFSDRPRDEVLEEYPQLKGKLSSANAVEGGLTGWIREKTVREARFYEVSEDKDELVMDGDGTIIFASTVPRAMLKRWEEEAEANEKPLVRRPTIRKSLKCHLIIGDQLVESKDLPGTMVPLVPWIGETTLIEGRYDRTGHTRSLVSAQQQLNYNWSSGVEFGALQSKTPWLVPVDTIEEFETYYGTANTVNHAWLPYKSRDDNGNELPAPQRMQPPIGAPVYAEGIQIARQFMQTASGQYDAEMGRPGNERSGKAIQERQRAGATATYHFTDNQSLSIRRQGVIVKEWIPIIYDTKRVAKILSINGDEGEVTIDPEAEKACEMRGVERIFNPMIGSYEVVSDVGPDWATQRQEAFNAIVQIITQAPQLIDRIGDLLFKVADFPLADEIAERLKPGLPPQAQAAIAALQEQLAKGNKLLGETLQALVEERTKSRNDENEAVVKAFDADTKRLAVVKDMIPMDPEAMALLVRETVAQALQDNLGPIIGHLTNAVTQPVAGGGEAPDGGAQLPVEVNNPGRAAVTPGGE